MNKPRADAKLKNLPEERQAEILDFARTHTHVETVAWLKEQGIETSPGPLSTFCSWYKFKLQMQENEAAIQEVLTQISKYDAHITPEELAKKAQLFFMGLAIQQRDLRAWCLLIQNQHRDTELKLLRERQAVEIRALKSKHFLNEPLVPLANILDANLRAIINQRQARPKPAAPPVATSQPINPTQPGKLAPGVAPKEPSPPKSFSAN